MYDLWVNGLLDVDRSVRLFNKSQRSHDPLSGIVDGANQYFYSRTTPLLSSGAVSVYTSGSNPLSDTEWSVDYASGLFVFNTAPTVQPTATYQTARYSDMQIRSLLIAGFDEMENRWYRGLCLSETIGSLSLVVETSGSAIITDSSGNAPASINGLSFEFSRNQIGFYVKCVQLAYLKSLIPESALFGYIWSESGGLKVDKSLTAKNLKYGIDAIEADMPKTTQNAQIEWIGADALYGGALPVAYTAEFVSHRWWQKQSIKENWRDNVQYQGSWW